MTFYPNKNSIEVQTYSPVLDEFTRPKATSAGLHHEGSANSHPMRDEVRKVVSFCIWVEELV